MPEYRAFLSVMIPLDVEIIAMPKPPSTIGNSLCFAYTLNPGLLILFNLVITGNFFLFFYFKIISMILFN